MIFSRVLSKMVGSTSGVKGSEPSDYRSRHEEAALWIFSLILEKYTLDLFSETL